MAYTTNKATTYRRNVFVLVLFEFAWGLGLPFTLFPTMVPAYLTALGASKFLIGAMQAMWTICTPIQIVSAHFHSGRRRPRNTVIIYAVAIGLRLVHDIVVNIAGSAISMVGQRALFAFGCIGFVIFIVYGQPLFFGLMTDNIPQQSRGRLYGLRTFGLGAGGLALGIVASYLLAGIDAPRNYQISFLLGDGMLLTSCLLLLFFRDDAAVDRKETIRTLLISAKTKIKTLLEEPNYRIFLMFHVLNVVAVNLAAFIVPYAKERLGFLDHQMGILSMVFLATGAVFGFMLGRLADRFGYRTVAITQSLALMLFFAIAIGARSHVVLYVAYVLYSLVNMSLLMVLVNMSVELCPGMTAVDLTALGTTIIVPVVALVGPVMGAVIDRTGDYFAVYMIGLAISAIALLGFVFIVQEPRRGRLYVIKQIMVR